MTIPESRVRKLQLLRRSLARGDVQAAGEVLEGSAGRISLPRACPGRRRTAGTPAGKAGYWLMSRTLRQIAPGEAAIAGEFASVVRGARRRLDELQASAELCRVADGRPEDMLFADIETCGLGGAPIFLVGEMAYADGDLLFRQRLARDYSEEAAICAAFAARLRRARVLVTFNGKAFDMTMLRERSAFHGIAMPRRDDMPPHVDLLHESRRRWRGSVANCRLQTLERYLCGRVRAGDIPGWAIPEAYHRFVETHDARQLADIVHHNMLDLLTMAQLLVAILTGCGDRES